MRFRKIQGQSITILGDLVLKNKAIVYDLARQRIGWVNYDSQSHLLGLKQRAWMMLPALREYNFLPSAKSHNKVTPTFPPLAQSEPSGETATVFTFMKEFIDVLSFYGCQHRHRFPSTHEIISPNPYRLRSFICCLYHVMATKVPSFRTGGTLWFTDLSALDAMGILPVFLALITVIHLESVKKTTDMIDWVPASLWIPLTASSPTAVLCF